MTLIREEAASDAAAIGRVLRDAFGREDEARLVNALRDGGHSRLSLVGEVEHNVIGHVLFSDILIATRQGSIPVLSLAPVAVAPAFQRQGIGAALIRLGLKVCRERGHRIVTVLGDARYYERFGFSTVAAVPLTSPWAGKHWLAMELAPGALAGIAGSVEYSPPFQSL